MPQFVGSELTLVHTLLHVIAPALQVHCPDTHTPPLPHDLPHMPQLFASDEMSVHVSVHATWP
jgi:hypothetical protein